MSFIKTHGLQLRAGAGLALTFLVIQIARPQLSTPPTVAGLQAPPEVENILRTSCYACHSNETRLAWFDEIVPAYWLVVHDVKKARSHLNFSELGRLPAAARKPILVQAVNLIQMGTMPLPSYLKLHPEAAITPSQLAVLRNYVLPASTIAPAALSVTEEAETQYRAWIAAAGHRGIVPPAPNGIAFFPDYNNWQTISTTERNDSESMRVILGNDVAVQAVAANRVNPWPDGAVLAKVAWLQQAGADGMIQTGAFLQVAFMIKDQKKYASTAGWGWAQWNGSDLKPYGADPGFASKCVACHTPLRQNDYVFTMPIPATRNSR